MPRSERDSDKKIKIFIDTNVFMDLYRAAHDPVSIFEELKKFSKYLVFTTQSPDEFWRNRNNVLRNIEKAFSESAKVNSYTTSLIKSLDGYDDLVAKRKDYNKAAEKIVAKLKFMQENPGHDNVAMEFQRLVGSCKVLPITDEAFQKAYRRKLLGNPPSSDKTTIGDELHWELLLAGADGDLVLVTRDKTFHRNAGFLENEFLAARDSKLCVLEKIGDALKKVGATPPDDLTRAEDEIEKEAQEQERLERTELRFMTCPRCNTSIHIYTQPGQTVVGVHCPTCKTPFAYAQRLPDAPWS